VIPGSPGGSGINLVDLLPSIIIGLMRLVTIAFAIYSPRMLETLFFHRRGSQVVASSAGISMNGSGTNCTFMGLFFVQ